VVKATNAFEHPQPHACFIQSIDDDLVGEGGIMDLWVREAPPVQIWIGDRTNSPSFAAKVNRCQAGAVVRLMSFLRIGDRAAGAIKSGGRPDGLPKWSVSIWTIPTSRSLSIGRWWKNKKSPQW